MWLVLQATSGWYVLPHVHPWYKKGYGNGNENRWITEVWILKFKASNGVGWRKWSLYFDSWETSDNGQVEGPTHISETYQMYSHGNTQPIGWGDDGMAHVWNSL